MPNPNLRHCQICGRAIKTVRGFPVVAVDGRGRQAADADETIAHHGYQRPGDGWQTSSCGGARWRPYEFACDALPPAIASCRNYIENQKASLAKHISEPPESLTYQRTDGYRPVGPEYVYQRPEGFNAANHPTVYQHSYVFEFDGITNRYKHRIKASEQSLQHLEKRLADWPRRNEKAA